MTPPTPPCTGGYWECVPMDYIVGDAVVVIFLIAIVYAVGYFFVHRDR